MEAKNVKSDWMVIGRSVTSGNIKKNIQKADKIVIKELIMKIKKGIPLIDQHDKNYLYGGKFGGNFIPETLKKTDRRSNNII